MGAWSWAPVTKELRARGHNVYPITLPGLSPDDLMHADEIGLETHVEDVLDVLNTVDAREAVMVANSYGGIVAGIAAGRAGNRVAHTVFVDAFLPTHGQSLISAFGEEGEAAVLAQIDAAGDGRWPVPGAAEFGMHSLNPSQVEWIHKQALGHPARTITERAYLQLLMSDLSATYIKSLEPYGEEYAENVEELRDNPNWQFLTIETGHWPMITMAGKLSHMIISSSAGVVS